MRDFDRVMMWGFGWEKGPFGMIDAIGPERIGVELKPFYEKATVLGFDGQYHATAPEPQYSTIKDYPILSTGESHNLRDLGDGVTAFCLTTKMGSITPKLVGELTNLLESGKVQRLVLTSEAKVYSVGYDLNFFHTSIQEAHFDLIDKELRALHRLGSLLEQIPSVAAVWGYALGAGLELAMSCSQVVAGPECQIGLPESRVGLIPGGRGTVIMRLRNQETAKRLGDAAIVLTEGTTAPNADQARELGYLRPTDVTVYHPDRLLAEAKAAALKASHSDLPAWKQMEGPVGGIIDRLLDDGKSRGTLTDYDRVIGDKVKCVFVKPTSYEEALVRERQEFVDLCGRPLTLARIRHMLENGKPLRN
ncbi:MAG: 3-hydroxyacyl-CoA dehydrogenase [Fimbriimonadaceae bacterium]|nr:3-hydroxyacyl-CoA dehydrogenase [Fimbriimonadaceae bacterium]